MKIDSRRVPSWCVLTLVAWASIALSLGAEAGESGTPGVAGVGEAVRDGHVEAQLIARQAAWVPGQTATAGLRLQMDEHWHTYWKNPGDAGLATEIAWELPEGYKAHEIDWPAPEYYEISGLATYGYEGEIVLPVRIEVPADAAVGQSVTIKATADWLVCKDICIPGSAALSITVPIVADSAEIESAPAAAALFEWAAKRTPRVFEDATIRVEPRPQRQYLLSIFNDIPNLDAKETASLRFFPDTAAQVAMAGDQAASPPGYGGVSLTLSLEPTQKWSDRLSGVLVYERGEDLRVYLVDVPVTPDPTELIPE